MKSIIGKLKPEGFGEKRMTVLNRGGQETGTKEFEMPKPLMPMATAVWLVDNTSLSFRQIGRFCELHVLEVQAIADETVAQTIVGQDPTLSDQLTRAEIERCQNDPSADLQLVVDEVPAQPRTKGPRYTPVSKRQDKPDAIAWILRHHPELSDAQIGRLIGTTKPTIEAIRSRSHWNIQNIQPKDPVSFGLCSQKDLDEAVHKAWEKTAKTAKPGEAPAAQADEPPVPQAKAPAIPDVEEPAAEEAPGDQAPAEEPEAVEPAAPEAEATEQSEPTAAEAEEPGADEPAAEEPVSEEPEAVEPAAPEAEATEQSEPTAAEAGEPGADEPAAEEPGADEAPAEKPATEKQAAEEPAAKEPEAEDAAAPEAPEPTSDDGDEPDKVEA